MLKQTRSEEPGPLTEADKPRKKLSFREPEIMGYLKQNVSSRLSWKGKSPKKKEPKVVSQDDIDVGRKKPSLLSKSAVVDDTRLATPPRSPTFYTQCTNCEKRRIHDALIEDDEELESQAMRVVRTVGQAFDVCHKLSISPEDDKPSEKDSTIDRKKKDNFSDGLSISDTVRGAESNSTLDIGSGPQSSPNTHRPLRLDLMNLPQQNTQRKSPLGGAGETYSSPMSETLDTGAADTPRASIPSAGTPLGAHHEQQLLREQLEQQTQQTQAAVAQVHLLRDQLAAETAARLEAQTRIHQLLVQNKELLDHISALVQLLQEQERLQQGNQTVTTVPQHMMMGDVGGMYHLPPELGGGGYLTAAPLPSTLSSSYYNLMSAGTPPMIHPGGAELLQRLRSFYYPQHRPGSSSFPGTPILPHRSDRPASQDDFRPGRLSQDDFRTARPGQEDFQPTRPSSGAQEDAFIRPLGEDDKKLDSRTDVRMQPDMRNLRLQDSRPTFIQRSTSEKVPNRSELMSQVTRAAWARHTTK